MKQVTYKRDGIYTKEDYGLKTDIVGITIGDEYIKTDDPEFWSKYQRAFLESNNEQYTSNSTSNSLLRKIKELFHK